MTQRGNILNRGVSGIWNSSDYAVSDGHVEQLAGQHRNSWDGPWQKGRCQSESPGTCCTKVPAPVPHTHAERIRGLKLRTNCQPAATHSSITPSTPHNQCMAVQHKTLQTAPPFYLTPTAFALDFRIPCFVLPCPLESYGKGHFPILFHLTSE